MSAAALKQGYMRVAQLSAKVFGQVWNPTRERTGLKYLRRLPVAESVVNYYPPPMHQWALDGMYQDFSNVYWREKADEMRKRGRGPPKKGQGKRTQGSKKKK